MSFPWSFSVHLKLLFETVMNWEFRFQIRLWTTAPQSVLLLPRPLFLALPNMNPWHLQQLTGWPLAAGTFVFRGCFFGFMAPSALVGSPAGTGPMSGVGGKEVQASACRNQKSCPRDIRCRDQRRKPVGSSLNKILCCVCCKSPKSCIESTALTATSKIFATLWMSTEK